MRVASLSLVLAVTNACSAVLIDDDGGAPESEAEATTSTSTTAGGTGPSPHPLDASPEVDCPDAEVSSNCAWTVESTAQACELRCQFADPCEVLAVDFDYDLQGYVDPIDEGRLGCLLDTLGASDQAYLEWTEHGTGMTVSSDTTYRAWLLRPEELVLARWHESTVDGNIGPFGQSLTAVHFDATQLLDCQAETQGVARYECLLQALTDSSCQSFGPASCE